MSRKRKNGVTGFGGDLGERGFWFCDVVEWPSLAIPSGCASDYA